MAKHESESALPQKAGRTGTRSTRLTSAPVRLPRVGSGPRGGARAVKLPPGGERDSRQACVEQYDFLLGVVIGLLVAIVVVGVLAFIAWVVLTNHRRR